MVGYNHQLVPPSSPEIADIYIRVSTKSILRNISDARDDDISSPAEGKNKAKASSDGGHKRRDDTLRGGEELGGFQQARHHEKSNNKKQKEGKQLYGNQRR